MTGQCAGVDSRNRRHARADEKVMKAAFGAPVRRVRALFVDDEACAPRANAFRVLDVHAGVADVRDRHANHLAVVRRVGQDFLVAGHRGVEDDLAVAFVSRQLAARANGG